VETAMLLAESPVTTSGIWGVVGVIAAGVLALLADWTRKRFGWGAKTEPPEPSEKVAANAASREILTWADEHVIQPMRRQLHEMGDRVDALQGQLDRREDELGEARATIRELRQQLAFMEQQLTDRQGQITVLLQQLGDRYGAARHDRPGQGSGPAPGVRPDAGSPEGDPSGAASGTAPP